MKTTYSRVYKLAICVSVLLMISTVYAALSINAYKDTIFLNNAKLPPCLDDLDSLPIFLVDVTYDDGLEAQGTAFLVNESQWMTAAHVVAGNVASISIDTPSGILYSNIVEFDDVADIAILETIPVNEYTPFVVKQNDHSFMDDVWNVGYPGWADENKVVSSGRVMGHSEGFIYTNAMVMGGMSGGPTLFCNGPQLEVSSVISLYIKELHTTKYMHTTNGIDIERTYVNTGESFSSPINRVDFPF